MSFTPELPLINIEREQIEERLISNISIGKINSPKIKPEKYIESPSPFILSGRNDFFQNEELYSLSDDEIQNDLKIKFEKYYASIRRVFSNKHLKKFDEDEIEKSCFFPKKEFENENDELIFETNDNNCNIFYNEDDNSDVNDSDDDYNLGILKILKKQRINKKFM